MTSFQPTPAGQANSDVTYSCSRPYQLAAKDNEIRALKAKVHEHESTIALLYGQLDTRSP
jgi:hypothetical protein